MTCNYYSVLETLGTEVRRQSRQRNTLTEREMRSWDPHCVVTVGYHWSTDTDMVSKVTHILRSHTILAQNTDIRRRKTLLVIPQTLFKWLLCIRHIMYCSCRGLDHVFKVLTKKSKKRPVHRKSAYNIRGSSQQKVSTALLRDLRGFWNQKKVTPLKVSC